MYATMSLTELVLPWGRMWGLSVPGLDQKFQKDFAVDLTIAGGADPDAVLRFGIGTKANPKDRLQIYTLELIPRDNFSHRNVQIEMFKYVNNQQADFKPADKAQRTNDAAVVVDTLLATDIFLEAGEDLGLSFTNLSALGIAGYTGLITGRLYREVN